MSEEIVAPAPDKLLVDPVDDALKSAVSAKLQQLAAQPVCAHALVAVQKFAASARAMLQACDPQSIRGGPFVGDLDEYSVEGPGYAPVISGGILAPSSESENFGSKAMRNIAGAGGFQKMMEDIVRLQNWTPEKILQAMAVAKENGLEEEYKELRGRLGLGSGLVEAKVKVDDNGHIKDIVFPEEVQP